ncbi:hypothetical protein DFJ77DRAFT_447312 [Powellomyces hirtus]|nr:hypothetical protein DFJ77DRAFT_447312 [Powellomyces hirtus]
MLGCPSSLLSQCCCKLVPRQLPSISSPTFSAWPILGHPQRPRQRFASTSRFCPYQTLKVPKTATRADVKKAYYKLVFSLHPDRVVAGGVGGDPPADRASKKKQTTDNEEFLRVVKAYEILSSSAKRKAWDSGAFTPPYSSTSSPSYSYAASGNRSYYYSTYPPPPPPPYSNGSWQDAYTYADPTFYPTQGGGNTQPQYMSNGKLATLVMLAAFASSCVVFWHVDRVRRQVRAQLNEQDRVNAEFYQERLRRARENGFEKQIAPFRARAAADREDNDIF